MKSLFFILAFFAFSLSTIAQVPYLVKDINTSSDLNGFPGNLTVYNGTLYFSAEDSVYGAELWKSDGTTNGTSLFYDCVSGGGKGMPERLNVFGSKLFFMAQDSAHGNELWLSDGTTQGTGMIKDINPIQHWFAFGQRFIEYNGLVYFNMILDNISQLWVTDGTEAGTHEVSSAVRNAYGLAVYDNKLFFYANYNGSLYGLCSTDGTVGGTNLVKPVSHLLGGGIYGNAYGVVNGKLLFNGRDSIQGEELWESDETTAGTYALKNICAGAGNGQPKFSKVIGGKMYFAAFDSINKWQPWVSDGTEPGTFMLKAVWTSGPIPANFTTFNGKVYFSAGGLLCYTDGTTAGTDTVSSFSYKPHTMLATDDRLFFTSLNSNTTLLSVDTNHNFRYYWYSSIDNSPSGVNSMTYFNGKLFFAGGDFTDGMELWALDSVSLTLPADTTTTSISSVSNKNKIVLYPNPNKGSFTISTNGELVSNVTITNLNGQYVSTDFSSSNNGLQLQMKDKMPGLYFVKLFYGDGRTSNHRFVISD